MKEKIVYNYNADTKVYTGKEICNEDPLDGGYLIPANCTEIEPEIVDGCIPVFEDCAWVNKENNIGKFRVVDNKVKEIKELGWYEYILTEEQLEEIHSGKLVKIENNQIVIYEREKTTEELIQIQQLYLNNTDWYVARFSETGVAIPDDIKLSRQVARDKINELREVM